MNIEDITKIISPIVLEQLPDYIKNDLDKFSGGDVSKVARFMELYYEWLEKENPISVNDYSSVSLQQVKDQSFLTIRSQSGNTYNSIVRLKSFRDVNNTIVKLLGNFRNEFAQGILGSQTADFRKSLPILKAFYESKGNEKSYHFLFRMMYNKLIELSYPIEETMFLSPDSAHQRKYIRIDDNFTGGVVESDLLETVEYYVVGVSSGSKAVVTSVRKDLKSPDNYFYELELRDDTIEGEFTAGEQVKFESESGVVKTLADGLSPIYVTTLCGITDVSFTTGGSGYYYTDTITVTPNGGVGWGLQIDKLSESSITDLNFSNWGSGYAIGDEIRSVGDYFIIRNLVGSPSVGMTITGGTSGATATIRNISSSEYWVDGIVGSFVVDEEVTTQGNQTFFIDKHYSTGTSPFIGEVTAVGGSNAISGYGIIDKGSGFTFPPFMYVDSSGGSSAVLTAVGQSGSEIGKITSVKIHDPGIHFNPSNLPTLAFTAKSSPYTTATGTAVLGTVITESLIKDQLNILDGQSHLRDADYYQEFSYLIDVDVLVYEWGKIIHKLVHPSGMKYWGRYKIHSDPPVTPVPIRDLTQRGWTSSLSSL